MKTPPFVRTQTYKQPSRSRRQNPAKSQPSISFGDYAHRAIRKHFKKSTKYEAAVLEDHDPEPLHQMRVGMRRLRTALLIFAPAINLPEAASRQQIIAIAKRLGRVRDLDVMQIWFQRYLENAAVPPAETRQMEQILISLHQRRDKQFSRMQKLLAGQHYHQCVESFQTWLHQPTYRPIATLPILDVLPDLLLPLISRLLLHPGWLVGTTVENGKCHASVVVSPELLGNYLEHEGAAVHDLRKQIKGVRYQTEFFVEFYDETFRAQTRDFRDLQDILGEIQDGIVLSEFLAGELGDYWQNMVPTLVNYLQQQRYQLWQQWQTKKKKYLDMGFRQGLRQQMLMPTTPHSEN